MRRGTGGQRGARGRRACAALQPGAARRRRLVDHEDRLAAAGPRARTASGRAPRPRARSPRLPRRSACARSTAPRSDGEDAAAAPRGDDVRAEMAERDELAALARRREAPEAAARDVLEEDALDRIVRAEAQDLGLRGLDEFSRNARNSRPGSAYRRRSPLPIAQAVGLRDADPPPSRARRLRRCRASSRATRCARSTSPRRTSRTRAGQRRARPARLHGHLGGQADLRPGHRHGLPRRDDRLRGADPARRQEAAPRRHLRRACSPTTRSAT